jgi:hypothetical protein
MVTNSFGKRNFMQPMGRPKGGEDFFSFSLGSHYVPFKFPNGFPSCFQYVPQVPNVFPNMFSIAPHFYPVYALANVVFLSHIWVGQRGGTLYIKIE